MTILKTALPEGSLLNDGNKKYDYADSFQGVFTDQQRDVNWPAIANAFFSSGPEWIGILFALRNRIVFFFGLKTPGSAKETERQRADFRFDQGQRVGVFKVFERTENEAILGEDDTHLNFRISVFVVQVKDAPRQKTLTISSVVEFNNWFGRLYFLCVKPFHHWIVPAILKGIIKELERKNTH